MLHDVGLPKYARHESARNGGEEKAPHHDNYKDNVVQHCSTIFNEVSSNPHSPKGLEVSTEMFDIF